VLATIEALRGKGWNIPDEAVLEGFRTAVWPGRFECVSQNPTIIIDGGHNQQCAEAIADALNEYFPGKKCTFLIGVMADKNFKGIFDALLPLAEKVYAVTPDSPRALKAPQLCEKLAEEYGFTNAVPYETLDDALCALRQGAKTEDLICICGSLYMVGDVRNAFGLEG
jgi:dihydrofolate synthase/folylpolyglutamate synthase